MLNVIAESMVSRSSPVGERERDYFSASVYWYVCGNCSGEFPLPLAANF